MEEKENTPRSDDSGSDKVDLTQLQSLDFGPNWSDSAPSLSGGRGEGPRRDRGDRTRPRPDGLRRDRRKGGRPETPRERGPSRESRPFEPTVSVQIVPEETGFHALCQAMRHACHTYELFEIAQLILAKPERFLVELKCKPPRDGEEPSVFHVAVPDDLPFETEEEAVNHVMQHHLDRFFEIEEIETDPPKGHFQYVSRCSMTGVLLGPPNYHRYTQILNEHHATRVPDMPFERFKAKLETLRDEESINAWVESMKKRMRYTFKEEVEDDRPCFFSPSEARAFLLSHCRNRVVRTAKAIRFPGARIQDLPAGDIRRSIETVLEKQRRFPLDTANGLRGRLRRHKFHIYKKGSHGVTYVCAVRRNFRRPDQVFAESVWNLIQFLERNPMIQASRLPEEFLGLKPAPGRDNGDTEESSQAAPAGESVVSPEDPRMKRLLLDLRWLVTEGYVAEYADGRLFVQPAQKPEPAPAPKSEKTEPSVPETDSDGEHEAVGNVPEETSAPEEQATPEDAAAPEETVGPEEVRSETPADGSNSSDETLPEPPSRESGTS